MRDRDRVTSDNLGWLLAKSSQRWNELLGQAFREAGFPEVRPSFGSVLVPLYEQDGLRMGELARRSGLSKQAITTLVRTVEATGLVTRARDPDDRRAFQIALTQRGEEFRPVAERVLRELEERVGTRLSETELDGLVNALREVMEL